MTNLTLSKRCPCPFLLARIAEDEAENNAAIDSEVANLRRDGLADTTRDDLLNLVDFNDGYSHPWRRGLDECEAKREVIAECRIAIEREVSAGRGGTSVLWGACMNILRHMTLPYSDHPDFHEAWRV